mgnify:CR=1 FL=1
MIGVNRNLWSRIFEAGPFGVVPISSEGIFGPAIAFFVRGPGFSQAFKRVPGLGQLDASAGFFQGRVPIQGLCESISR